MLTEGGSNRERTDSESLWGADVADLFKSASSARFWLIRLWSRWVRWHINKQNADSLTFVFASFTCFFKPSISFFASSADGLDLFFLALTGDSSIEISESKIVTSGRFAFSPGAFCTAPLLLVFEAAWDSPWSSIRSCISLPRLLIRRWMKRSGVLEFAFFFLVMPRVSNTICRVPWLTDFPAPLSRSLWILIEYDVKSVCWRMAVEIAYRLFSLRRPFPYQKLLFLLK